MAELKTKPTEISAEAFLDMVEPEARRAEGRALDAIFRQATGWQPRMWGPSIIGYGRYRYTYESGHSGESCATGFSPRKADLVLYVSAGLQETAEPLSRLGRHKIGKSCLYFKRLSDVDKTVVEEIIRLGVEDMRRRWPVDEG